MLFDNEFNDNLFIQNMFDNSYNNNLVSDSKGLERGNMFNNEYIPYKNYNPSNVRANTEKGALLIKLYETDFALNDISLYLDLYPDDKEMYKTFKKYVNEYENYKKMYESKYGILDKNCDTSNDYEWINNPWPWDDMGGIKDV